MKTHKARIVMDGHGRGKVFVDDVEVQHVQRCEVFVEANEQNVLILHMVPDEIEIEGEFEITHIGSFCREFAAGGKPE